MPVPCRRGDRRVAEEALDRVQVDAGFEQRRRTRMAQRVNPAWLHEARAPFRRLVRPLETGRIHRPITAARGKEPLDRPMDLPVSPQGVQQGRGEHGVPVLPAFALLDADRHPRRVDVGDPEMDHLVEPQAGGVGRHEHRPVFEIRRVGDQPLHVLPAEQRRELARLSHRRNPEGRPVTLQRRVIEERQRMHDDVAGTPRSVAIPNQMQQVRLHLRIRYLIRRPPVERRQPRDRPQVRLARAIRQPPHDQVLVHPSPSLGHHTPPA